MLFFKLLFLFGVLQAELPSGTDSDGWVAIERPDKEAAPTGADETDPSIWVIFAKEMRSEKILVGFPSEPTYRYLGENGSEMEIVGISEKSEHRLKISKATTDFLSARKTALEGAIFSEVEGVDLLYWKDGYWFMEHLAASEEHNFLFQTKCAVLDSANHQTFVASFDFEKK